MPEKASTTQINIKKPVRNDGVARQPNERDEAPDQHPARPRKIIKQAAKDLKKGLVDTDLHGQRGIEEVVKPVRKSRG
ncbi:MAG: hypothetical protein WBD81_23470 [Collimonas pratensis]|uniref:hypothetical protein n=1 Tax=Collimonas pratensis TaxID=279113 RepID=UPI003C74B5F6